MYIEDIIKLNFDTVLKDYEYTVSIVEKTHIYFELKYKINNLRLSVNIELTDHFFTIEIKVEKEGKKYAISDTKVGLESYYLDKKLEFKNIFDFSDISENEFWQERDILIKKRFKPFVWKKNINRLAQLYANLVSSSLDNIMIWSSLSKKN